MNSTQLHYREATRALERATTRNVPIEQTTVFALEAVAHALLAATTALEELTRQASVEATDDLSTVTYLGPVNTEAVARAVGVLRPIPLHHHAHNAFGSDR